MQEIQNVSEGLMTAITKLFVALAGGNLLMVTAALVDIVPAASVLVTFLFLVWGGMLMIRERKLAIRINQMTLEEKERQRDIDNSQG